MYTCPICGENGVSIWGRLFSSPWFPASCSQCGNKVCVSPKGNAVIGAVSFFAFFVFGYIAVKYHSWLPMIVFVLLLLLSGFLIPLKGYERKEN